MVDENVDFRTKAAVKVGESFFLVTTFFSPQKKYEF
jgi:hypothetical protein